MKLTPWCLTLVTPRTTQSMEFSRLEYWSEKPFPSPGVLPDPGIEPGSPALQADSLPAEPQGSPRILEWVAFPFSKGIFLTQESNRGLLHGRRILYQSSYQGSLMKNQSQISLFPIRFSSSITNLPWGYQASRLEQ